MLPVLRFGLFEGHPGGEDISHPIFACNDRQKAADTPPSSLIQAMMQRLTSQRIEALDGEEKTAFGGMKDGVQD
jgi:hypothetical protein